MSPGRVMRALPPCPPVCPPLHAAPRVTPVRYAASTLARSSLEVARTPGRDVRVVVAELCPEPTQEATTPCAPLPLACHSHAYMVRPSDASREGISSGLTLPGSLTSLLADSIALHWRPCTCAPHRPVAPALLHTLWCDITDDCVGSASSTAADPHMSAHRSCLPRMIKPCINAGTLGR